MKSKLLLLVCLGISIISVAQERFLQYNSKDSINGHPKIKGSLGVNLKLNGYYDVYGGLQDSETFNIGNINVFGTDDSGSFKMDLYQTQVKLQSEFITKKGKLIEAMVEFDFWGGNGRMRLRKAYVKTSHWLIGQTFVAFGDPELWPNIMEWEGPPSGIWVRKPLINYFNSFKNKNWTYLISLNAPITDFDRFGEIEPFIEEANQTTPDLTFAFNYNEIWGHLRLASIVRSVQYKLDNEQDSFFGYGFAFSGMYRHEENNFQFQLAGGKGISAYNTSVQGFGYDGFLSSSGKVEALPSYGGWASYEFFYNPKFHSTLVVGYTRFFSNEMNRILVNEELDQQTVVINGNVNNWHYYGIINLMYDPIERMTLGIELDYGKKKLHFDGLINNAQLNDEKSRNAMRLSFGIMYAF